MNRIHVLEPEIAKRLAAGEVVQNPASVVKELVENSIDAGATSVTVEIQQGGIEKIRVTDNGSGIHPDDMPFALVKHATSKIDAFDDIYSISTLGFRGEALASISAVSNIEIKSQAVNEDEGRILKNFGVNAGKAEPAGLPFGTSVIVSDIFYNIPARKKFLKTPAQEGFAVTDLIAKLILSRPDISFRFINSGKNIYHSPGNGKIINAVAAVYGSDLIPHLNEVNFDDGFLRVSGFVSDTQLVYRTSKNQSFFVNNRYVISKMMTDAVNDGYNERLMKGRFPFTIIYLDIPASSVDVNVHPSKAFVSIDNAKEIIPKITQSVREAINFYSVPKVHLSVPDYISDDTDETDTHISSQRLSFEEIVDKETNTIPESEDTAVFRYINNYRIIGSVFDTYLIIETENKVFFIDQHAAHERINYENLISGAVSSSRPLLLPIILNLSEEDLSVFQANSDVIQETGLVFEDFGGNSVKVTAVPSVLLNESLREFVEDIIMELKKSKDNIVLKKDKLIRYACRMSVKAGDRLSDEEIRLLVNELIVSDIIPACPHGRPVAVEMTRDDFEKSFKRKL